MVESVVSVSLFAAAATLLLCTIQILKRPSALQQKKALLLKLHSDKIFRYSLLRTSILAVLGFGAIFGLGYYLEFVRHGRSSFQVIFLATLSFCIFLAFAFLGDVLLVRMQRVAAELIRENASRIFRFFLYAGAFLGSLLTILALGYVFFVQSPEIENAPIFFLPVYAAALVVFWLRFHGALLSRSCDYAYELMRKQEAVLPLMGNVNPLWRLRQLFASTNRFFFLHLEYLILVVVVLNVGSRIELTLATGTGGTPGFLFMVFGLGALASLPGLIIMRVRDNTSPETLLWNIRIGYIAALVAQSIVCYLLFIVHSGWHIKYFWIIFLGSLTTFFLNVYSAVSVAENHKTARALISAAASSVSTVVHRGIAAGMRGAAIPAVILIAMMALIYLLGIVDERGSDRFLYGIYALALALTSMLSLFTVNHAAALVMPLSSSVIAHLRLNANKREEEQFLSKFRSLRSISVPSYVLQAKVFLTALVLLGFLVYAELMQEKSVTSFFNHLTETTALLVGGIGSYFLAARINEIVLKLGPLLVRETSRQFREIAGLSSAEAEPDLKGLWAHAQSYLNLKALPLFLATIFLPALVCLVGGMFAVAGYLIGFAFFTFLNANSWLTTGAAWSSARHAAEADTQVARYSTQLDALVEADIVGDSMHEAVAPTLSTALLVTLIAAFLFAPMTLELHDELRVVITRLF